ncbi:MAG: DUF3105 domain-containing protein [Carbonactinosporaceae bacterium]
MTSKAKQSAKQRRQKVEEMRRQQRSAERRKTLLFIGIAVVLGLGLIAAAAVPVVMKSLNDPTDKAVSSFGVAAGQAGCGEVLTDKASGSGIHVGPNTDKPGETTVDYATVPPSFGKHYAVWAPFERHFYTEKDRPRIENLVHNLEHGYTVVWYDSTVKGEQLAALEGLADKIPSDPKSGKFIVSAWDDSYGDLPQGMHVGMSHWTASDGGKRLLCGKVSGEAIADFVQQFPQTDAPEPQGG